MPVDSFDEWVAPRYERLWPELFAPELIEQTVGVLAELAGSGPALEFGVGTGRIALPLSRHGVRVHGLEISAAMLAQLRARQNGANVEVTRGDFATTRVAGRFTLVYLLRNTIRNLTSQDEQVAAFGNAAAHLHAGGYFVVENYIPALQYLPPGQNAHLFAHTPTHLGVEEYDLANQIAVSHHWWIIDGQTRTFSSPHRYAWPGELDLMARLAGIRLRKRYQDWRRTPFISASRSHISVWQKAAGG